MLGLDALSLSLSLQVMVLDLQGFHLTATICNSMKQTDIDKKTTVIDQLFQRAWEPHFGLWTHVLSKKEFMTFIIIIPPLFFPIEHFPNFSGSGRVSKP